MLDTTERKDVKYFVGTEVENSLMKDQLTLFVVGIQPLNEIIQRAKDIQHIYLGTSQSFQPLTPKDWVLWDRLVYNLLAQNYWVTLDFDVKFANNVYEYDWCDSNRFIPMISVKLPNINWYNYNTVLKIDDITWGHTNPGVWTHTLYDLMQSKNFTAWNNYVEDHSIT